MKILVDIYKVGHPKEPCTFAVKITDHRWNLPCDKWFIICDAESAQTIYYHVGTDDGVRLMNGHMISSSLPTEAVRKLLESTAYLPAIGCRLRELEEEQ